jgi:hypothetical protein
MSPERLIVFSFDALHMAARSQNPSDKMVSGRESFLNTEVCNDVSKIVHSE